MDAIVQPETVVKKINCASKTTPCPKCGKRGKRKRRHNRKVRSIEYGKILILDITYGEYTAKCSCCKSFSNAPEGVKLRWRYDNKVREAVLNRILEDAMSVEGVIRAMERDFHLNLSSGFIYDCLRHEVGRLDMNEYRQFVLGKFSGVLCVDELHLGQYTLLLATDPLADLPVAFALVKKNDQDHMRRFLKNLKNWGFLPRVVVTDGSNLYPTVLAKLWPNAEHQLCVFHVIKDINEKILEEVRRLRRQLANQGRKGRKRRRGRPRGGKRRQKLTNQKKAKFIFKHRFLITMRRENLTKGQRETLATMLAYLPALRTLREFTDRVHRLFEEKQSEHQAYCRRAALLREPAYQKHRGLVEALAMLQDDVKFRKMIAFLRSPASRRTARKITTGRWPISSSPRLKPV